MKILIIIINVVLFLSSTMILDHFKLPTPYNYIVGFSIGLLAGQAIAYLLLKDR